MNNNISFGILANQTDKRWNTFIEEMNERFNENYQGSLMTEFYGCDSKGKYYSSPNAKNFQTIITLDDYFAEGSVYRVLPEKEKDDWTPPTIEDAVKYLREKYLIDSSGESHMINMLIGFYDRQKLQQEIEQLEKELNVKRDKLSGL